MLYILNFVFVGGFILGSIIGLVKIVHDLFVK